MNHKSNYLKVLNTLSEVETKGESTIAVANCLKFLAQCATMCDAEAKEKEGEENDEDNKGDNSNS